MGRSKTSEAGALVLKRGGRRDRGGNNALTKTGFDGLSEAPWRKTPSIFKQPVTLVRTTSRNISKAPPPDLQKRIMKNRERLEQPRQLFWARSLEGLRAMIPMNVSDRIRPDELESMHVEQRLALPSKIESTIRVLSEEAATATLCSALQLNTNASTAIIGQPLTKTEIDTNPLATINFLQPLVQIPTIAEQDIAAQEKRVLDARKRLQELRKSFVIR